MVPKLSPLGAVMTSESARQPIRIDERFAPLMNSGVGSSLLQKLERAEVRFAMGLEFVRVVEIRWPLATHENQLTLVVSEGKLLNIGNVGVVEVLRNSR